jgi:hypothetical protein
MRHIRRVHATHCSRQPAKTRLHSSFNFATPSLGMHRFLEGLGDGPRIRRQEITGLTTTTMQRGNSRWPAKYDQRRPSLHRSFRLDFGDHPPTAGRGPRITERPHFALRRECPQTRWCQEGREDPCGVRRHCPVSEIINPVASIPT